MLTRTKLIIDVHEILSEVGSRRELVFTERVDDLRNELARVDPADPIAFDLVVEAMEGSILVSGTLRGRYVTACRRCLGEQTHTFDAEASEVYRPPSDVWEKRYVVADEQIDLDPLLRDNVLIDLPQYPLCREDCRGLCSTCGAELNEGDCGCAPSDIDIRWSALRELMDRS